jgi:hypothetical protein
VREFTTSTSLPRSPYKVSYILPLIAKKCWDTNGLKQGSLPSSRAIR